jgi:hypothetical protein
MDENQGSAGAARRFAAPPPARSTTKSSKDIDDLLGDFKGTEMAKPARQSPTHSAPSGTVAPAPAYAPSPASNRMRNYPAESAASAPAPSAPSLVKKKAWRQSDEEAEGSREADTDDLATEAQGKNDKDDKNDSKAKRADQPGPSLDESVRKAERLYASQDWNGAAAAYRDLLNRFPSHKDAPRWRDRMNESNDAYQRTLEAKRKKWRTDAPLSGSKE